VPRRQHPIVQLARLAPQADLAPARAGRELGGDREQLGQRNLAVTANTYSHVMGDEAELDYESVLT
jgi:hypothetical protein